MKKKLLVILLVVLIVAVFATIGVLFFSGKDGKSMSPYKDIAGVYEDDVYQFVLREDQTGRISVSSSILNVKYDITYEISGNKILVHNINLNQDAVYSYVLSGKVLKLTVDKTGSIITLTKIG